MKRASRVWHLVLNALMMEVTMFSSTKVSYQGNVPLNCKIQFSTVVDSVMLNA